MQIDLDEFKTSFMVDGGLILFTADPSIDVIERMEHILRDVATDAIRQSLERDL